MRYILPHIALLFCWTACTGPSTERPVWLNASETISIPGDSLSFKADGTHWTAQLASFSQPIPLRIHHTDAGFTLSAKAAYGVTEGPAQLVLSNGRQQFYYDVVLHNTTPGLIAENDYRSPKTVNPDSSLEQHRIAHRIDEWNNIQLPADPSNLFQETMMRLPATAGTFRAQADKPLSAYYVQPGSCTSIPVKARFEKLNNAFLVTAGPLQDKHQNTVADGTLVAFTYSDGDKTYRMEASLLHGYATVSIPAQKNKPYQLTANVLQMYSRTIQLLP